MGFAQRLQRRTQLGKVGQVHKLVEGGGEVAGAAGSTEKTQAGKKVAMIAATFRYDAGITNAVSEAGA